MEVVIKHRENGGVWDLYDLMDHYNVGSEGDLSEFEISGVPVIPNINTAILRAIEAPGNALNMKDWHGDGWSQDTCKTTHCIAGWAVHLAGEDGYKLEKMVPINMDGENTPVAAALIFAASGYPLIPCFYDSNEDALEALKVRAAQETKGETP